MKKVQKLLIVSIIILMSVTVSFAQYNNILLNNTWNPNETSIMINPKNPNVIVAGSNAYSALFDSTASGFYFSSNGGINWGSGFIPYRNGIMPYGDPVIIVDTLGNYFYIQNSYNVSPRKLIHLVCKSTDGGQTWLPGVTYGENGKECDKPWCCIDITNGPYGNYLYSTYTEFDTYGSINPLDSTRIMFTRSTDGGQTFSVPKRISRYGGNATDGSGTVEGAVPCVGPLGQIYVSWAGPRGICFNKSTDGGNTWMATESDIVPPYPNGWAYSIPGFYRCNGFPITCCDLSNGPNRGTIYVNWSDQRNGNTDTDVWLIKSTNGGQTWSTLKRVNNDPPGYHNFLNWMCVDQATGCLYFVFYDRRNTAGSATEVYIACSNDGGENFTNFKVSETPFITTLYEFMGDYNGISAYNGKVMPIWTRSMGGSTSIYTAVITAFSGVKIAADKNQITFRDTEVSTVSDTVSLEVTSLGCDTLLISDIQIPNSCIQMLTNVSYPVKLGYLQQINLKFRFVPSSAGNFADSIKIISNDNLIPQKYVRYTAKGYVINPAVAGTIYGITGPQSNGNFISINKSTGAGTLIGPSGFTDITSISICPSNNRIYGVSPLSSSSRLYVINAVQGDVKTFYNIPLPGIRTIAFDVNNELYCGNQNGLLYKYNIFTKDTLYIGNTGITNLFGIAVNPINGQLWGITLNNKIYRINKLTGASVQAGIPGFSLTPSIAFSHSGKLYGLSGVASQTGLLIQYDTSSGTASLIGSTGYTGLISIAISQQTVGIENISNEVPALYNLSQNYPNPFNPVTNIKFDLPNSGTVSLKVYDVLGREVKTIVNEMKQAGRYKVDFDGSTLTSGVYFYKLESNGFSVIKKMLLIK